MGDATALLVGASVGLVEMVFITVWFIVRGRLPERLPAVVLFVSLAVIVALAIASGSFKGALLVMLGFGVGIAVSSLITLPLFALSRGRIQRLAEKQ